MAAQSGRAWVMLAAVTLVAGCGLVLDVDDEHHLVSAGGGGAGGTAGGAGGSSTGGTGGSTSGSSGSGGMGATGGCGGASGVLGEPGAPCPVAGQLGCQHNGSASTVICGSDGQWVANATCAGGTLCDSAPGMDQGTCKQVVNVCTGKCGGDVVCDGQKRVECGPDLVTSKDLETCVEQTCVEGACVGECAPGQTRCSGNTVQICDAGGMWQDDVTCVSPLALCSSGACVVPPPSCIGLATTCGPRGNESCCASAVVPGGTYNRSNDPNYPATVSDFRLDRFEITVGRFRKFVTAYPGSKPADGAGAHPLIAGSGWDAAWNASLPADQASLKTAVKCSAYQTWTDAAGANETLPMNCINWYEAFAFCAWDGGRLPTEAEWNYAAAGGDEQKEYPWSSPPESEMIDSTYAVYGGASLVVVGSKSSKGDGKWGQADLAGSVWEWNLDWYKNPYSVPCNNCANLQAASGRVVRGGCWVNDASYLLSGSRSGVAPTNRGNYYGARCARTP